MNAVSKFYKNCETNDRNVSAKKTNRKRLYVLKNRPIYFNAKTTAYLAAAESYPTETKTSTSAERCCLLVCGWENVFAQK